MKNFEITSFIVCPCKSPFVATEILCSFMLSLLVPVIYSLNLLFFELFIHEMAARYNNALLHRVSSLSYASVV